MHIDYDTATGESKQPPLIRKQRFQTSLQIMSELVNIIHAELGIAPVMHHMSLHSGDRHLLSACGSLEKLNRVSRLSRDCDFTDSQIRELARVALFQELDTVLETYSAFNADHHGQQAYEDTIHKYVPRISEDNE